MKHLIFKNMVLLSLDSLFNFISTVVGCFFKDKTILLKRQSCYYLTHNWGNKRLRTK